MNFRHAFEVEASLETVGQFHRQSASMGRITPPPVVVQIHAAQPLLDEGAQMDFTLWLGPLPIRWLAQIEQVTANGFVDRQARGPFARWIHTHRFEAVAAKRTRVVDEIELELSRHWGWRLVGLGMWLSLPLLFAFRAWKTRRALSA